MPVDDQPEQKQDEALARLRIEEESKRHTAEQVTKKAEYRWSAIKTIGVAFVGTLAVGIITSVVNWQIQNRQIAIEEKRFDAEEQAAKRSLEQQYLSEFVTDALSEDIQRRVDFAQYVASVTFDKEMRKLWADYHATLENDLTSTRADLNTRISELTRELSESQGGNQEEIKRLNAEIQRLEERLGQPRQEIRESAILINVSVEGEIYTATMLRNPYVGIKDEKPKCSGKIGIANKIIFSDCQNSISAVLIGDSFEMFAIGAGAYEAVYFTASSVLKSFVILSEELDAMIEFEL